MTPTELELRGRELRGRLEAAGRHRRDANKLRQHVESAARLLLDVEARLPSRQYTNWLRRYGIPHQTVASLVRKFGDDLAQARQQARQRTRAYNKQYHAARRAKINVSKKEYRKQNADRLREYERRRYLRRKELTHR